MALAAQEVVTRLTASANKLPPLSSTCSFDFIGKKWLSGEQVNALNERRRFLLRAGRFEVCKQRRIGICKRCGTQIEKMAIRFSYPSTAKSGNAVTVLVHVECAVKEFEVLQQIARVGDKEYVADRIIGFDALKKAERAALLQSLHSPVPSPPPRLPESHASELVALVPHATPRAFQKPLQPFQQEGLSWLLQQEAGGEAEAEGEEGRQWLRGGILADEMGMGKTLQVIALMVASPVQGATLVVVPPTCLSQWQQELHDFVKPGTLQIYKYLGSGRSLPENFVGKAVVLTTYKTLETEYRRQDEPPRKRRRQDEAEEVLVWDEVQRDVVESPLFAKRWARIVLDEAHRIKNARGNTAQAAFKLLTMDGRRWCVSGTPMQNRTGDIGSLVRFLRMYPYGFNRCQRKRCTCECFFVNTGGGDMCQDCGHNKRQHCSVFTKTISTPIRQCGFLGKGKEALETLRLQIFRRIMLRRAKAATLQLPPLTITEKKISLTPGETAAYQRVKVEGMEVVKELLAKGQLMQNFAHVFSMILRQRQAANHRQLAQFHLDATCPFCQCKVKIMDEDTEPLPCGNHWCHEICYIETMRDAPDMDCPYCDSEPQELHGDTIVEGLQQAGRKIRTSSKIQALIQEIEECSSEPPHKFLVFSCFAHFLELCSYFLEEAGIANVVLSGRTSMKTRSQIIKRFWEEDDLRVLLISLQVGGEGLNLQVADRVVLLDPWWNPAMEQQAYQRAHRLGQERDVEVIRFVAEHTIEEKILLLQKKKQCTFDSTVMGCNDSLLKLTSDDIQMLFRD